jgi:two-component system, OmpR family, sensor kinase
MTLSTRVSLFFVATLGLVLACSSLGVYLLARTYLLGQVEARLDSALRTLAAGAESSEEGIEWEPHQRTLVLDEGAENRPLYWTVSDARGKRLDGSKAISANAFPWPAPAMRGDGSTAFLPISWEGERWLARLSRVTAADSVATPPGTQRGGQDEDPPHDGRLLIRVSTSLEPALATLRSVGWLVSGVSLVSWLLAVIVGRDICHRALGPVSRMATAARRMTGTAIEHRLPVAPTRDELQELGQAFNGLLDRLQESLERQRQFTASASHQLRTPLAAMLGQIEVALRHDRSSEEYRRVLSLAHDQAQELRQIIDSLLFLSRADDEARLPQLVHLDLVQWLAARTRIWEELPRGTDVALRIDGPTPLIVDAQPVLLGQLLDNLIDNACKYGDPGTTITVHARQSANNVAVSVSDCGQGIAADDVPRLFTPFFRGAAARAKGIRGTGLGLAIAARLARAMGGSIEASSEIAQGSVFTLLLRCVPPVAQSKPIVDDPPAIESCPASPGNTMAAQ